MLPPPNSRPILTPMVDDWGSLFQQGWRIANEPTSTLVDLAHASSYVTVALVTAPPHFPFVPLMELVRIHCSLSKRSPAACRYHVETAVTLAEHTLALSENNYPGGDAIKLKLLIKDALGCALHQRYLCLAQDSDCIRAIDLHRACLKHECADFPSKKVQASWNHHLSVALTNLVRDYWTTGRLPEMKEAFSTGYAALRLSGWSNPYHWVTLCSFRVFMMLETKHHSISSVDRRQPNSYTPTSLIHDVAWFLHSRAARLARVWLTRASRLNPEPYLAKAIKILELVLFLTSIDQRYPGHFDWCAQKVEALLFGGQYEFDLRHSSYLLDLLGALARCRRLGLQREDLIERIGAQLDRILPGRLELMNNESDIKLDIPAHHFERPRLHHTLGEALYSNISAQKLAGHRNLKYGGSIKHFLAALTLTHDGHPRQLQFALSLAFPLAGSAQSTGATNVHSAEHLHEFYNLIQLIAALQMEGGGSQRDISRGEEFEKIVPLLFSLSLDDQSEVADFAQGYMEYRYGLATINSEQHIAAGTAFANLLVRRCLTIVDSPVQSGRFSVAFGSFMGPISATSQSGDRSDHKSSLPATILNSTNATRYNWESYGYVNRALQTWKDLHNNYPDNSGVQFGYGAAMSIKADHFSFQLECSHLAHSLYGAGIEQMRVSLETGAWSPLIEVRNRMFLAETFLKRHNVNRRIGGRDQMDQSDVDRALEQQEMAASISESAGLPATINYSVVTIWTRNALDFDHETASDACRAHARALSQLSWVGLDLNSRLKALKDGDQALAARSLIWAIEKGQPELAFELSEGRQTIFFSSVTSTFRAPRMQQLQYRELLDEYQSTGAEIAEKSIPFTGSSITDPRQLNNQLATLSLELGDLGIKLDECIKKIRKIPDQENFAKQIPFTDLAAGNSNRLIVSVVSCQKRDRCYALLLLEGRPQMTLLPLSHSDAEEIRQRCKAVLESKFRRARSEKHTRNSYRMTRWRDMRTDQAAIMKEILKELWILVMQPIVNFIEGIIARQTEELPQLWLNATGHFSSLPLHAAGVYDDLWKPVDGESVLDHFVCSYTPSLSSLLPRSASPPTSFKALAIGSGKGLSNVGLEMEEVDRIFSQKSLSCKTLGGGINIDALQKDLQESHIFHCASHANQSLDNPLESKLDFDGGLRLMMQELMKLYLPNAKLAVLFACETGQGDKELINESLHLAGAMLSVGFSGAIGTLWPMNDTDGVPVCRTFYTTLLEGAGLGIDYSRAGLALHKAVCELRDDGVGLLRWATFAHFGQ